MIIKDLLKRVGLVMLCVGLLSGPIIGSPEESSPTIEFALPTAQQMKDGLAFAATMSAVWLAGTFIVGHAVPALWNTIAPRHKENIKWYAKWIASATVSCWLVNAFSPQIARTLKFMGDSVEVKPYVSEVACPRTS
jgi:hypothetical protein